MRTSEGLGIIVHTVTYSNRTHSPIVSRCENVIILYDCVIFLFSKNITDFNNILSRDIHVEVWQRLGFQKQPGNSGHCQPVTWLLIFCDVAILHN